MKLHEEIPWMLVTVRLLGVAVFLIATVGTAAGAIVKVSGPGSVDAGSSFQVGVGVESVANLYAAQFSMAFNPSLLWVNHVSEGAFLEQGGASTFWIPPVIDNDAGTITGAVVTRLGNISGVTGSGTIASIYFYAKSPGSSILSLNGVLLSDPNAQPISFSQQDGSVDLDVPPSPPETWISSGPSGTINATTATFTWSGTDSDGYVAYYRYRMDVQGWVTTAQTSHAFTGLSKGSHTLYVVAVDNDELSDPSPASRSFVVQYTANPDTQIVSGPEGTVEGETASFEWIGTDPDGSVVSYLYRLDGQEWSQTAQTKHTYPNLSHGNHTFRVKAVDDDGLEDPTPAQLDFTLIPFWWQEEMARLNGAIAGLQDALGSARADLEKVEGEKQDLKRQRDQLQGQVSTLQGRVDTLQAEGTGLENQVRVLESQVILLEAEIENLDNTTAHQEAAITGLQQQLGTAEDRNQALSQELGGLKGQLSQTQEESNRIKGMLETTQQEKASLQAQVAALRGETAGLEQQVRGLGDRIANLTTYEQALTMENELTREETVRLGAQLDDLQTQMLNKKAEIAQMREEAAQAQLEMDELEGERNAAVSANALLQGGNHSLVQAKRALEAALAVMGIVAAVLLGLVIRSSKKPNPVWPSARDRRP